MHSDTIIIGNDPRPPQAKLAFSAGLARSVKLASLETLLDSHLNSTKHFPTLLLRGKKLPVNREGVLRSLGELLVLRGELNLHSELLDSPEFCWTSPSMEQLFDRISRNLDVRPRIQIFNKKLDYANELAVVLREHLKENHSLKLEWIIIILIAIEVAFELVHWAERLGIGGVGEWVEKKEKEKLERMMMKSSSSSPSSSLSLSSSEKVEDKVENWKEENMIDDNTLTDKN